MSALQRVRAPKAPPGFRSEAALKRLRRVAIVAGVTPILLLVGAYAVILGSVFAFGGHAGSQWAQAYAVGHLGPTRYYVGQQTFGQGLALMKVEPGQKEAKVADIQGTQNDTFLLDDPTQARLWVISDHQSGYWDASAMHWLSGTQPWSNGTRPFLWDGQPATAVRVGGQVDLWQVRDDAWKRVAQVSLKGVDDSGLCEDAKLRVVQSRGRLQWFFMDDQNLRHFEGMPSGKNLDIHHWSSIRSAAPPQNWAPKALATGLSVVELQKDKAVKVWSQENGAWHSLTRAVGRANTAALTEEVGGTVIVTAGPGIHLLSVNPEAKSIALEKSVNLAAALTILLPFLVMMVLFFVGPFAMLFFLDRESRRARPATMHFGRRQRPLAGLFRRGAARVIDCVLVMLVSTPVAVIVGYTLGAFKEKPTQFPSHFFFLILAWVALNAVLYLGLVIQLGLKGWTPGRYWLGVRVLGFDLKPCGVGRSLLRGLLVMVDGQLLWLPGILMASLTQYQQRLGDLVADTVVVEA